MIALFFETFWDFFDQKEKKSLHISKKSSTFAGVIE